MEVEYLCDRFYSFYFYIFGRENEISARQFEIDGSGCQIGWQTDRASEWRLMVFGDKSPLGTCCSPPRLTRSRERCCTALAVRWRRVTASSVKINRFRGSRCREEEINKREGGRDRERESNPNPPTDATYVPPLFANPSSTMGERQRTDGQGKVRRRGCGIQRNAGVTDKARHLLFTIRTTIIRCVVAKSSSSSLLWFCKVS